MPIEKVCITCKKRFYVKPFRMNKAKCCSIRCSKIGNKNNLGKKRSQETIIKLSISHMGQKAWNKGIPCSGKTKRKLSISHKGKKTGSKNHNWKGGICKHQGNRILILYPSHPFADKHGYIRRSHLIMENRLGRLLLPTEIVHHVNNIKDDDRIENLQLFESNSAHAKHHYPKGSKFGANCNNHISP